MVDKIDNQWLHYEKKWRQNFNSWDGYHKRCKVKPKKK